MLPTASLFSINSKLVAFPDILSVLESSFYHFEQGIILIHQEAF